MMRYAKNGKTVKVRFTATVAGTYWIVNPIERFVYEVKADRLIPGRYHEENILP